MLEKTSVVALLAATLGAGLGTSTTLLLTPKPPKAPRGVAADALERPDESRPPNDVDLTDLEGRLRAVERRLSLLTTAVAQGRPADAEQGDPNAPLPKGASDVADPVFEAAVLDILDRDRETRENERDRERTNRQTAALDSSVANLTAKLGLSPPQAERLRTVAETYAASMRALRDQMNESGQPLTRSERRTRMNEFRQTVEADLTALLRVDQLEKYRALEPDERIETSGRRRESSENRREPAVVENAPASNTRQR